jgi:MoxR-like ATPase
VQVRDDAAGVAVPAAINALLSDLRAWIQRSAGAGGTAAATAGAPYLSDRRLTKAVKMLKVAAFASGRDEVALHDCLLLEHVMWSRPEEAPALREWLLARALPHSVDAEDLNAALDAAYLEVCALCLLRVTCSVFSTRYPSLTLACIPHSAAVPLILP